MTILYRPMMYITGIVSRTILLASKAIWGIMRRQRHYLRNVSVILGRWKPITICIGAISVRCWDWRGVILKPIVLQKVCDCWPQRRNLRKRWGFLSLMCIILFSNRGSMITIWEITMVLFRK